MHVTYQVLSTTDQSVRLGTWDRTDYALYGQDSADCGSRQVAKIQRLGASYRD